MTRPEVPHVAGVAWAVWTSALHPTVPTGETEAAVIAIQERVCGQRLSEPVSQRRDLLPVLRVSPLSYFPRILASEPQGVFSHMSIPFSPGKLQGEERKKVLQAVQKQAKVAACAAVKLVLEAEVSIKLGREKGEARRISGQERPHGTHHGCSSRHPIGWHLGDDHEPTGEDQARQTQTAAQTAYRSKDGDPGGPRLLAIWQA